MKDSYRLRRGLARALCKECRGLAPCNPAMPTGEAGFAAVAKRDAQVIGSHLVSEESANVAARIADLLLELRPG